MAFRIYAEDEMILASYSPYSGPNFLFKKMGFQIKDDFNVSIPNDKITRLQNNRESFKDKIWGIEKIDICNEQIVLITSTCKVLMSKYEDNIDM